MVKSKVALVCSICGCTYLCHPYRAKTSKYCSKVCWSRRNPPKTGSCEFCGKEYTAWYRPQRFCSRSCAGHRTPGNAWKDGKSMDRERARYGHDLKVWREQVYKRDEYKCRHCGATGELQAHHIEPWAACRESRFVVNNGLTLCIPCHSKIHGRVLRSVRRPRMCPSCGAITSGRGMGGRCHSCATRAQWVRQRNQEAERVPASEVAA